MRIISSEELNLVSGGSQASDSVATAQKVQKQNGWFDTIGNFISGLFGGGSSGPACQPSSYQANGTTVTQLCGPNGVSTTITSGRGYVITSVTTPNAGGNASLSFGTVGANGGYSGGYTTTITTCNGGSCKVARY